MENIGGDGYVKELQPLHTDKDGRVYYLVMLRVADGDQK